MEPFKSLMRLWVRNMSISAIWLEKVVTPLIEPAIKMAATQTTNNNSIRSILDKEKLNCSNFLDWYHNLRIVLMNEQKLHHLKEALPEVPPVTTTATVAVRNAYTRRQAEQELFETVKAYHACKQEEGQSVSTYVLKMKRMNLVYLAEPIGYGDQEPHFLILTSLLKDYDQFVQNYNMHGMGKTIHELHVMLKLAEKGIPKKAPVALAIRQGQIQKPKSQAQGKGKKIGKGKSKLAYNSKHKTPPLLELKKNKASTSCTTGIFTIELFSFPKSNSWIYDTGYNTIQGLRGYQKLNKGALDLYVSNGNSAAVEAIRSFNLILPNGDNGFRHKFMDNGAVAKDNVFYFNVIPCDGIFKIDMHNHISSERSIYACSNKKPKNDLDSNFLWHC
nr:hypothetical protein [Tanacetum cinerariifolium]